MAKLHFQTNHSHTIGVELELGIVNAQTQQLVPRVDALQRVIRPLYLGALPC